MNSKEKFINYYQKEKNILEKEMTQYNKQLIQEENLLIKENIEVFKNLNMDGKMIRGILVKLGYHLLKEKTDYSNQLALAYELFQTSILVHDDIIDKDEKRRGKDTIHTAYYNKHKSEDEEIEDTKHIANSVALCIGDYGLFSANKIISENYQNDKNIGKVLNNFNSTVLNTIKGELLDVILPSQSKKQLINQFALEDNIMNIYRLKTAHYTIIGPLSVGMILAGADSKKIRDIHEFGEKVGIAFQIQDDILGIYSDEMGKVKGSDIKEFKQTILYSYICTTLYKKELLKYYGTDLLTDEIMEKVKDLFEKSGAKKYAETKMNEMYQESIKILKSINWLDTEKKELLEGFVEYLKSRNK